MSKKVYLIDLMAMAYRCHFAFGSRPLKNGDGLPTSAIFGAASFLMKLIREERPDYLIAATDCREPTFRHGLHDQYKANRKPMPEDLVTQLPYLEQLLAGLGIPMIRQPGWEADDIIGTLCHTFRGPGHSVFIVSGDKDFFQLLDGHTFLYSPKKGGTAEIAGPDQVQKRFQCTPDIVRDVFALMGDTSDNIPGVPGIGEKTAIKLISQFGTLETLLANLDQVESARFRKLLRENQTMARLSYDLFKIDTQCPVPESFIRTHKLTQENKNALEGFFSEMEFGQLFRALPSFFTDQATQVNPACNTIANRDCLYILVDSSEKFASLMADWQNSTRFSFDTETTGLDICKDIPLGIAFSFATKKAYYLPLNELSFLERPQLLESLRQILSEPQKLKIGHNLKFDLQVLANIEIMARGPFADSMIAAHLLDPINRGNSLDICCSKYLSYKKIPISQLIGSDGKKPMQEIPMEQLYPYACEDADLTLELFEHLEPMLKEQDLARTFYEVEGPLVPILAQMEQTGIFIDKKMLSELAMEIENQLQVLTKSIFELAGESFNINSTQQLQQVIFEKLKIHEQLGIKRLKKTKTGFSTDVSVLEELQDHPFAAKILKYRTLAKLKNTYVDTLPKLVHEQTQRLHTSYHQTGTATGRLSSSNPNLQNIPIRSPLGKKIRKAFKTRQEDYVILSADYSQVELRLLAHLAKEEQLEKAFASKQDIHAKTASLIFDVPQDQVTSQQRSQAKSINFGIIYGMGPQRLAKKTKVSLKIAKNFIERYFASYPGIEKYIQQSIEFANKNLFVRTLSGRMRPIPDISAGNRLAQVNAENVAINSPVQGSAADLIKLAMIKVHNELSQQGFAAKLLLQVHDELVFECPRGEATQVCALVKQAMESAMSLKVPLEVQIAAGPSWLEAH